jgi:trehalose 6-phosphate synthase/phosphatase
MPPSSFPHPASSLRPSFHPALPPSRAPSPDVNGGSTLASGQVTPKDRWVLYPRRGHSALNSGIKSLSSRPLLVVGRPDDLLQDPGVPLTSNQLGPEEKKDLERGLSQMGAQGRDGVTCAPVWVEDKLHQGMLHAAFHFSPIMTNRSLFFRFLRGNVQNLSLANLPLPFAPRQHQQNC